VAVRRTEAHRPAAPRMGPRGTPPPPTPSIRAPAHPSPAPRPWRDRHAESAFSRTIFRRSIGRCCTIGHACRSRGRPGAPRAGRRVPRSHPRQRARLGAGAGHRALRRRAGPGRPGARRAGRGLPRRRRAGRAQGNGPLRRVAGRCRGDDGPAASLDALRGGLPGMSGSSFAFATATSVLFGAGRADELPDLVGGLGARPFVCTGARSERHAELIDRLPSPHVIFPQAGEPTLDDARDAAAAARAHGADVVVAVGGGSVLDLGKAVAALLGNGTDPLDHLEIVGRGQPITRPSVPFVAVPTTAGTGAEVTANAVLAAPEAGLKASLRSPHLLPRVALVDPLL